MASGRDYRIVSHDIVFPIDPGAVAAQGLSVRSITYELRADDGPGVGPNGIRPQPAATDGDNAAIPQEPPAETAASPTPNRSTQYVVDRGTSAALLIYNKERNCVVLVRQFRPSTLRDDAPGEGWLLELPSGRIEENSDPLETAADCATREALEETGYRATTSRHIATLLPSPGILSERIYLYFTDDAKVVGPGGGVAAKGERTQRVEVLLQDLFEMLDKGQLTDAKLVCAAQWLKLNPPRSTDRDPLPPGGGTQWQWTAPPHKKLPPPRIGYKTGLVDEIRGIDAWINAENTDMQMPRFFDTGLSASIRYLGAARGLDGTIYEDTIAVALRAAVAGQFFVKPGAVIPTKSGNLKHTHDVRRLFHVACVQHRRGEKPLTDAAAAAEGLERALQMAERDNRRAWNRLWSGHARRRSAIPAAKKWRLSRWWDRQLKWLLPRRVTSVLVPLIGAGNGGLPPQKVAAALTDTVSKFFRNHPETIIREVYFIAFNGIEKKALDTVLAQHPDRLRSPTETGKPPSQQA